MGYSMEVGTAARVLSAFEEYNMAEINGASPIGVTLELTTGSSVGTTAITNTAQLVFNVTVSGAPVTVNKVKLYPYGSQDYFNIDLVTSGVTGAAVFETSGTYTIPIGGIAIGVS